MQNNAETRQTVSANRFLFYLFCALLFISFYKLLLVLILLPFKSLYCYVLALAFSFPAPFLRQRFRNIRHSVLMVSTGFFQGGDVFKEMFIGCQSRRYRILILQRNHE